MDPPLLCVPGAHAVMAWAGKPSRFWLHTCGFDHPRALGYYQRAGFVPYKQEIKLFDDPYVSGVMSPRKT